MTFMDLIYHLYEVRGREILDSRGNPTVEAKVNINLRIGTAKAPSGASTGKYEAVELRDKDMSRYDGKGTLKAVSNINNLLGEKIGKGIEFKSLKEFDDFILKIDGTKNKSNFGANATIALSMAAAKAMAEEHKLELYKFLGGVFGNTLPVPMMNILNGGAHADNNVDIQEFMIMPVGAKSFKEAMEMSVEVYHNLKSILKQRGLATSVGDEGGFAPNLETHEEAIELIIEAVETKGYKMEKDFVLSIDAAASEWWDGKKYIMPKSKKEFSNLELIEYWEKLIEKYPIYSLEDPFSEDDWEGFKEFTKKYGNMLQIVGDDLFVTNKEKLEKGIKEKSANAILIKPNQIGTLTETLEVIKLAKQNNMATVISHRSGETADTTIADIAVGINSMQIKTGAPTRSDRIEKYNRLMEIEEVLGNDAIYAGWNAFKFDLSNRNKK